MKPYWDSSALISTFHEDRVAEKLRMESGITRIHSLAEVFSTLTGGRLPIRVGADEAARMIENLTERIEVISLTKSDTLDALRKARSKGIRGARVHDYLHSVAAVRHSCTVIYTLNTNDFEGIYPVMKVMPP